MLKFLTTGKVLSGHVIERHHVTSDFTCGMLCIAKQKCMSINYKPNGAGDNLCELNDATRKKSPESYHDDAQYKHYYDVEKEVRQ